MSPAIQKFQWVTAPAGKKVGECVEQYVELVVKSKRLILVAMPDEANPPSGQLLQVDSGERVLLRIRCHEDDLSALAALVVERERARTLEGK